MTTSAASSLQFDTDTAQQNIIQQAFWAAIEEGRKVYSMALFFIRLFIFTEDILRQEVFALISTMIKKERLLSASHPRAIEISEWQLMNFHKDSSNCLYSAVLEVFTVFQLQQLP